MIYKFYKGCELTDGGYYVADQARYDYYLEDCTVYEDPEVISMAKSITTYLRHAVIVKDKKNVTLDFNGATVVCHGRIQPFLFLNCENITIKNVKIDYDRPFYTQGKVLECDKEHIRFVPSKGFDCRVEDSYLYALSDTWEKNLNDWLPLFWLYDKDATQSKSIMLANIGKETFPLENPPMPVKQLLAEQEGDSIVLRGEFPEDWTADNNMVLITHEPRDKNSFVFIGCKNVVMGGIQLLSGAAFGTVALRCENVFVDGYHIISDYNGNERMICANADGIHTYNCRGQVQIRNCYMEGLLDDTVNVHGNYLRISKVDGQTLTLICDNTELDPNMKMILPGDRIAIYHQRTQKQNGLFTVTAIEPDAGSRGYRCTVQEPTEHLVSGDVVENMTAQPEILIENCYFGKFRGTMRLQSRGKTVVRDCVFDNEIVSMIFTGDTTYWFESSPVNDVLIENCRFPHTQFGPRIGIYGEVDFTREHDTYHKNITIRNCWFEQGRILEANHMQNLVFENNESDGQMEILLRECRNCQISGAKVITE
jgi:polygalacturonase